MWPVLVLFLLMPLLSLPLSARADEIAASIGQRYGGSFEDVNTAVTFELADSSSYGVLIDFDSEPNKQIEVYLSRQDTSLMANDLFTGDPLFDLTIDYYHIGGLVMYGEGEGMRPFVSGTFGLTQMNPKGSDLSTENKFSLSLGGGGKVFITRRLGLRFGVRGIYTSVNSNSAIFCSSGCAIKVNSSGFVQTELSASLVMAF
jgi:hypothetical protein